MRGLGSTAALVLVLAGLGAYIYFVESKKPAPGFEPDDKVFTVESDQIDEITLTAGGETTTLVKNDSGWQLTSPITTDADPTEVASLVTNLSSMSLSRVVDENVTDLAPYGLAEPAIKVAYKAEGGASGEVHLGDKTPTMGDLYATSPGGTRVFLVSSYIETMFDKRPFDLRDKRVVKFERDKVDNLEIVRGRDTIRLKRANGEWTVEQPMKGRADYAMVEGFITRLSTARLSEIKDDNATDLKQYGLDNPSMRITVGAGSSQAVLEMGLMDDDGPLARDRARSLVFTLDDTLNDDLKRPFDEYHKKDFFESRAFNTTQFRVTRNTGGTVATWEFARVKQDDTDKWTVTPEGGDTIDADGPKVDELLNRLADLRVQAFVDQTRQTGLDAPVLDVTVTYDADKTERMSVGLAGGRHYGNREGEEATGELEASAVTAVLDALDAAVIPPAPTAATDSPQ